MTSAEEKLGYRFSNKELLTRALTHSSARGGKHIKGDNERLEFLGDSVLQLVTSKFLYMGLTDAKEGRMTKIRATLVCEESLASIAKELNLGAEILMDKGEEQSGGRSRPSILSDALEAVIAAIYLDGGFSAAEAFVLKRFPSAESLASVKNVTGDYKTELQEIIQQNPEEHIVYETTVGGEANGVPLFHSEVKLNEQTIGSGKGISKKKAEQEAAREALRLMGI
ncbi:MAG: ribonuclease III [Oscillospiraceae bacterium]|nr:ribonuclease III [Oscillospiraceae bacterium]